MSLKLYRAPKSDGFLLAPILLRSIDLVYVIFLLEYLFCQYHEELLHIPGKKDSHHRIPSIFQLWLRFLVIENCVLRYTDLFLQPL